jgi:hypothetical protein
MCEYVALGSNCSVTWWLNQYKLRSCAYPFDWSNVSIIQINKILKNNFKNYSETLEIQFISDKFLSVEGDSTAVIKNSYGVKFAHEVLTTDIENFKKSIDNRITRFYELKSKDYIVYVRIELKPLNEKYLKELQELIQLLNNINTNYLLKIIIHKDTKIKISFDKVEIHNFETFSEDWKMSFINWSDVLIGK